jgi:hypothetical protein
VLAKGKFARVNVFEKFRYGLLARMEERVVGNKTFQSPLLFIGEVVVSRAGIRELMRD